MTTDRASSPSWTIRQAGGATRLDDVRRNIRDMIGVGLDAVGIALDLPTQMGLDATDELTAGEVAQVGVHLSSPADLEVLLGDVDLAQIESSFGGAPTAPAIYAMFVRYARSKGVDPATLRGVFANDILNEYVAYGTFIYPPAAALRVVCDMVAFAVRETPRVVPLTVSGFHSREAGCTSAQEIGIALAFVEQYLKSLRDKGVEPAVAASAIAISLNATPDLFGEVAKFRAVREAWKILLRDQFGVDAPKLRLHVRTSGAAYSSAQTELNIARGTVAALAAVLGGAHTISVAGFDATSGLPSPFAQQIATQTQRILAEEVHAVDGIGLLESDAMKRLAAQVESEALDVASTVRGWGGALAAILSGRLQRYVGEAADAFFQEIESGRRIKVGETAYAETFATGKIEASREKPNAAGLREEHAARLAVLRAARNQDAWRAANNELVAAAKNPGADLMGPIFAAVDAGAAVSEIASALKSVFGGYGDEMAGI